MARQRFGDRVFIGAGAKLIGGVSIGDDVFIGVDAVVTVDVPSNSKVTCAAGVDVVTETSRADPVV